jgi:hypothetical protein
LDWKKLIAGAAALVVAFLLGFVPQYREAGGLRGELREAREQVGSLQLKARLAELRDLASLTYLESNARNYGVARQHSTKLFTLSTEIAGETSDQGLRSLLSEIAQERDHITAGLAEGKGAVQLDIEKLARRLFENTAK